MKTLEESVLSAMDCTDSDILPFLPYILQDFWEIGSDPDVMIDLIKKHLTRINPFKVLDLGSGKGAVSISIAKALGGQCYGIDAIPEFITFSTEKAMAYGVGDLCKFEEGDIRDMIHTLGKYDVIILGAIGQVLGNYFETLTQLDNHLADGGIIIIDDGYVEDEDSFAVLSKKNLLNQITDAGMQLIDEVNVNGDKCVIESYDAEYKSLLKRCQELSIMYPEKAVMFSNYSDQQKQEYENMKTDIKCSTMVISRLKA